VREDVLKQIIAEAPFGYAYHRLVLDGEGRPKDHILFEVNRAFEEMTGLRAQDILGRPLTEAIPGIDIEEDSLDWGQFYGTLTPEGGKAETVRYTKALGRWYRVTAFSPEPHHFVTIFQDVTSEMRQVALLEEQQQKINRLLRDYELIFENAHDGIFLVELRNGEFRYLKVNPAFKSITGFEECDVVGKRPPELPGWEQFGRRLEESYARCWQSKAPLSYEVRALVPRGERVWQTVLNPVGNGDEVGYLVGLMRDITSEKLALEKVETKARYEEAIATIARLGLRERNIEAFMPEALRLLGECLNTSRVYVFERDEEKGTLSNTYEWVAPGIEAQKENLQNLPEGEFAWWTERLARGQIINYRDIEEIPEDYTRDVLRAQDIKSILVIPLFVEGRYWGFLGFDECTRHRIWTGDDLALLNLAADIVSSYLERYLTREKLCQENRRFKALVGSTEDVIFELDTEQRHRGVYGRWLGRYGLSPEQFLGKTARDFFGDEEGKVHENANLKALSGEFVTYEWQGQTAEGARHYQTSLSPIVGEQGEVTGIVGIGRDITPLVELQQALQAEKELLRVTLSSIGDAVVTTDVRGIITSANPAALKISGWEEKEVTGKRFSQVFQLVNELTGKEVEDPVSRVLRTGKIKKLANHTALVRKDGRKVSIADSAAPIRDGQGRVLGVVMVFRDVSRERKKQERIRYLSVRDPLTGLFNRRFMEEKLKEIEASEHRPCTVLMADVNGLKFVNDVFGHQEGDRLLKAAVRVLERSCGRESYAARWGGDEFLLLLPGGPEQAERLAETIRARSAKVKGTGIALSLALGWAAKTAPGQSFCQVLKEAEENMYRNKLVEGRSYRRSIVDSLVNTLNARSIETQEHCQRIRHLCTLMAERLGLSARDRDELTLLALLHDIGKIGLSETILNKPGPLTDEEWDEIRKHPEIGYRIAHNTPELGKVADLILYHHERWDGRGYPWGLKGEEIPYLCRVMAVADAFDAMTGSRPYRSPVRFREALSEIERNAGTQFDPDVARLFIEIMQE